MSNKIVFFNPHTKQMRLSPIGFSIFQAFWFFPALSRGDWKWAAIQLVLLPFTFCWSQIFFMFTYNKLYIRDLLRDGYYPLNSDQAKLIVAYNVCSLEEMQRYKQIYLSGRVSSEDLYK